MRHTFISHAPNSAIIVVAKENETNYYVMSCHFHTGTGLKNSLFALCKAADYEQVTIKFDTRKLLQPYVDLIRMFSFSQLNQVNRHLLIRQAGDFSDTPIDIEGLAVDRNDNFHTVKNIDKAKKFAVLNMYGERISILDSEQEALSVLGKDSVEFARSY